MIAALCLLAAAPHARAQSWTLTIGGSGKTTGGQKAAQSYTLPVTASGTVGLGTIAAGNSAYNPKPGITVTAEAPLTVTGTWSGGTAPASTVLMEQVTASASGMTTGASGNGIPVQGAVSDGLGDGAQPDANGQVAGLVYVPETGGSFKVSPSVSASVSASPGPDWNLNGAIGIGYCTGSASIGPVSFTASPVTIDPGGAIKDSSGAWHILIGQQCTPTLSGIPTALQGDVSNLQWTVTGETLQGGEWSVTAGQSSATFAGFNAAYTYTQNTLQSTPPAWYWDDLAGSQTITCKATVTPPSGEGSAFTVNATQTVVLDVPAYNNVEPTGVVQINNKYPPINTPPGQPANQNVWCLWAGPGSNNTPPNGIQFRDSVLTPALYGGGGSWYHLQIATPDRSRTPYQGSTSIPAQGNGLAGLDGSYPYGQTFNANGTIASSPDDDGPGFALSDMYDEYNVSNETYQMYIMYTPPAPSITVPLAYYTWQWNVDVHQPTVGWVNAVNENTGGTISSSGAANRQYVYPTWSRIVSTAW